MSKPTMHVVGSEVEKMAKDARDICGYFQAMLFRMMERFHAPLVKGTVTYGVPDFFDKSAEAIGGSLKNRRTANVV